MKVRLIHGIGEPGARWTSSKELVEVKWDADGIVGRLPEYGDVEFVENWSENGTTTRRLFGQPWEPTKEELKALDIPTIYVGRGGSNSLIPGPEGTQTFTWSGLCGGVLILNPVSVHSGRENDLKVYPLPEARPGYMWIKTYHGSVLIEHVLVEVGADGKIHPRHLMPCKRWHRATLSAQEKLAQAVEETA